MVSNLIFVLIVLIIMIVILFVLNLNNKRLHGKIEAERVIYYEYIRQIKDLKKEKSNEENLEKLDNFAREFFYKVFILKKSLTYLELVKEFKIQGNMKCAEFCKSMSDLFYRGEVVNHKEIKRLIDSYLEIVKVYDPFLNKIKSKF